MRTSSGVDSLKRGRGLSDSFYFAANKNIIMINRNAIKLLELSRKYKM